MTLEAITSADEVTHRAMVAIRAIPIGLFDERAAMNLISSIQARLTECGWRHQEHSGDASDYLIDAHQTLEQAAEKKEIND